MARTAIHRFGFGAMVGLKLFAIAIALLCRRLLPRRYTAIVPAGLAVPWLLATLLNASLYVAVS
ncbi:hypothetical protein BRC82_10230 [Halobacteriales archaeon QS_1_67_19]|nr:MAG: hypothetical protein BRC82_10230 [Halobacteriales archaeon QS_1_67_19]